MSSTGNCRDNAAAELFFATLKSELMYRHAWPTRRGVFDEIRNYIENFYNCDRRHSKISGASPLD